MRKKITNKKTDSQYKKAALALRPYVDFKIDLRKTLTKAEKAKITKYKKELDRMTAGKPYALQIYKSRDKNRLKKVQAFGGQDTRLKEFKVAFVPKTSKHQKIKFDKKGEVYTKSNYVKTNFIEIDQEELIDENLATIVYEKVKNRSEKRFTIQAGDWEIPNTYGKKQVGQKLAQLALEYGNETANNFIGNWCKGIYAHDFDNQEDLDSYREAKRNAKLKIHRAKLKAEKNKRIPLYYWYVTDGDYVIQTKTDNKPDSKSVEITKKEYINFIEKGSLNG